MSTDPRTEVESLAAGAAATAEAIGRDASVALTAAEIEDVCCEAMGLVTAAQRIEDVLTEMHTAAQRVGLGQNGGPDA